MTSDPKEIPVRHYDRVAEELQNGFRAQGLWAKAYSDALADENLTKALYIRYRAESFYEQEKLEAEQKAKQEADDKARQAKEKLEADLRAKLEAEQKATEEAKYRAEKAREASESNQQEAWVIMLFFVSLAVVLLCFWPAFFRY